ncbi:MAG: flagellar hook-basal body protein [Planctomycetota bacterium]
MIYGTYLSATGIAQAQAKQDVIANNLANAETVGFRRLITLHKQRDASPGGPESLENRTGGSISLPTRLDTSPGGLEQTNRPLDVALVGDGYLTVRKDTPTGPETYLTRDGRMTLDGDRRIVLVNDPTAVVLGRDAQPLTVPADVAESSLVLDEDGNLMGRDGTAVGHIRTATVSDPTRLKPIGGGLFDAAEPLIDAPSSSMRSGFIETSNVDPTLELTRMIRVARQLEANANLIRHQDTTLGRLIEASAIA